MRKLIVLICAVLAIYMIFARKKHEPKAVQTSDLEETAQTAKSEIPAQNKAIDKGQNSDSDPASDIKNHSQIPYSKTSENKPAKSTQTDLEKKEIVPNGITNDRQISDVDPSYTAPDFLKGVSAITAKYVHVRDVIKNAVQTDIESAFNNGQPLSKFISQRLQVPRDYNVTVHYDELEKPYLQMEMKFRADYSTEPLQGQLSLKINGIEKSCDAGKIGPLKSLKVLADDTSAIVIAACDKSFYFEMYYNGVHDFVGNYYERVNGRLRRTGEAMTTKKFND